MTIASILPWAAGLAIGGLFGWAWGFTASKRALPHVPIGEAAAYQAGWDAAREECLRIARAHDFDTIERRLTAMKRRG